MKKIFTFSLTLSCLISILFFLQNNVVFAKISDNPSINLAENSISCVLADGDSGEIVFEKNSNEKRPIASMTKIMTLLVIYDSINNEKLTLDTQVSIGKNSASMGGSQVFLEEGTNHKASDLIKSIIIASANDSCVALAEHICGSEDLFVSEMNKKASQLNLIATNFVNCTGLPALNQYSCAQDCVKMFLALINQDNNYFEYSKIWMEDYLHPSGRITSISNTNKLVKFYEGCDGGKTGYTNEAQHCLCATAKRQDTRLIACVIGEPDSKTRFAEVSEMFNYGFANFSNNVFLNKDSIVENDIKNGRTSVLKTKPQKNLSAFVKKGESTNDLKVITEFEKISAPFEIGEVVGNAFLIKNGEVIDKTPLISMEKIEKKSYFDYILEIIRSW